MSDIKTELEQGQRYLDSPIYARPKQVSALTANIGAMFGQNHQAQPLVIGHDRVFLRWLVPDKKGGLKPKKQTKAQA